MTDLCQIQMLYLRDTIQILWKVNFYNSLFVSLQPQILHLLGGYGKNVIHESVITHTLSSIIPH